MTKICLKTRYYYCSYNGCKYRTKKSKNLFNHIKYKYMIEENYLCSKFNIIIK